MYGMQGKKKLILLMMSIVCGLFLLITGMLSAYAREVYSEDFTGDAINNTDMFDFYTKPDGPFAYFEDGVCKLGAKQSDPNTVVSIGSLFTKTTFGPVLVTADVCADQISGQTTNRNALFIGMRVKGTGDGNFYNSSNNGIWFSFNKLTTSTNMWIGNTTSAGKNVSVANPLNYGNLRKVTVVDTGAEILVLGYDDSGTAVQIVRAVVNATSVDIYPGTATTNPTNLTLTLPSTGYVVFQGNSAKAAVDNINIVANPYSEKDLSNFTFLNLPQQAVMDGNNIIFDNVPPNTDVTHLIARYDCSAGATVTVGNIMQQSGVTANDFTIPVNYTVVAEDMTRKVYTVVVKKGLYFNTTVNYDETHININISGMAPVDREQEVSAAVYDQNNQTVYSAMATCGSDGAFTFSYTLENNTANDGTYTVKVEIPGKMAAQGSFDINLARIISHINEISASEDYNQMNTKILNYGNEFGLEVGPDSYYHDLSNKGGALLQSVYSSLCGKNYTSIGLFKTMFNNAIAVTCLTNANLNSPNDKLYFISAISGLNDILGMKPEVIADLGGLNPDNKQKALEVVYHKPYTDLETLVNDLSDKVMVLTVNEAGRDEITGILDRYGVRLLGENQNRYDDLSGKDKIYFLTGMIARDYNTITDITNEAADILDEIDANNRKGSGGTTGNSHGGGTTTLNISKEVPLPTAQPDAIEFIDISDYPWAIESIKALVDQKVIDGMGGNIFKPEEQVTREQFVKMLISALKLEKADAECNFKDVSKDQWFYPYLASAAQLGIVKGMEDGGFGVGQAITRQEMAVLAYRAAVKKGLQMNEVNAEMEFVDHSSIDGYAVEAVKSMQKAGIINGTGDSRFEPLQTANRAMAAKVVYCLWNNLKE